MSAAPGSTRFSSTTGRPADIRVRSGVDRPPRDAAARDAGNVTGEAISDRADHLKDTAVDLDTAGERAFTGALIVAADSYAGPALALVADADIADPFCRIIVGAVRMMHAEGILLDPATVAGYVRSRGLMQAGRTLTMLASELFALSRDAVPVMLPYLGTIVVEQAVRRDLAAIGDGVVRLSRGADVRQLAEAITSTIAPVPGLLDRLVTA